MLFTVYDRTGKKPYFYTYHETCIPSKEDQEAMKQAGYKIKIDPKKEPPASSLPRK